MGLVLVCWVGDWGGDGTRGIAVAGSLVLFVLLLLSVVVVVVSVIIS